MWQDDPCDHNSPISDAPGNLRSSYIVTGPIRVYGINVYSSSVAAQFILMWDRSILPADTSVPMFTFNIGASSALGVYYGEMGRVFHQGLVLCNSTTDTTKTIGSANCFFDIEYDFLPTLPRGQSSGVQ